MGFVSAVFEAKPDLYLCGVIYVCNGYTYFQSFFQSSYLFKEISYFASLVYSQLFKNRTSDFLYVGVRVI